MTSLYLYAIVDHPEGLLPAEPGLGDSPLTYVVYEGIGAVVSPVKTKVTATEARLWRHEAVVENLIARHAVLPVRFNTVLDDRETLHNILHKHYTRFLADLQQVRGRVELSLRVLWEDNDSLPEDNDLTADGPTEVPRADGRGRAYMMTRLNRERRGLTSRQRANHLAEGIHTVLKPLAAQSELKVVSTPYQLLTASYLVEQDRVTDFRQAVEILTASYPGLHFLCTGPWPAYSFVETRIV